MQSKATLRYLRIAPRKVRLVAELIRGRKVGEAQAILRSTTKNGAVHIQKTLRAAIASAKNNFELQEENLYVAKVAVDEGPKLKRFRPRARGRAYPIQKKTSHITLILDELVKSTPQVKTKGKKIEVAADTTEVKEELQRPKLRPEREIKGAKKSSGLQKMFRRKAM
jgi:large subunit ribosomal protein L22